MVAVLSRLWRAQSCAQDGVHLGLLPDDVLCLVFQFCRDPLGHDHSLMIRATCRKWRAAMGSYQSVRTVAQVVVSPSVELWTRGLRDMHGRPRPFGQIRLQEWAAALGHLKTLQSLLPNIAQNVADGEVAPMRVCEYALRNGHLPILAWLHENGFAFKSWHCCVAAQYGHLPALQWLRRLVGTWNASTLFEYALRTGRTEILGWLHENGFAFHPRHCCVAVQYGQMATLQWLRARGCPWDQNTLLTAVQHQHVAIFEWAVAQGCPEPSAASLRCVS